MFAGPQILTAVAALAPQQAGTKAAMSPVAAGSDGFAALLVGQALPAPVPLPGPTREGLPSDILHAAPAVSGPAPALGGPAPGETGAAGKPAAAIGLSGQPGSGEHDDAATTLFPPLQGPPGHQHSAAGLSPGGRALLQPGTAPDGTVAPPAGAASDTSTSLPGETAGTGLPEGVQPAGDTLATGTSDESDASAALPLADVAPRAAALATAPPYRPAVGTSGPESDGRRPAEPSSINTFPAAKQAPGSTVLDGAAVGPVAPRPPAATGGLPPKGHPAQGTPDPSLELRPAIDQLRSASEGRVVLADGAGGVDPAVEAPAVPVRGDVPSRPAGVSQAVPVQLAERSSGTPADQVQVQLARAANHRIERIVVQLEPAHLGKVEIRLDFADGDRIGAAIFADRPETLDALQRDASALERSLRDAGFRPDGGGLSFSLRREQQNHQESAGAMVPTDSEGTDPDANPGPVSPALVRNLNILDIEA